MSIFVYDYKICEIRSNALKTSLAFKLLTVHRTLLQSMIYITTAEHTNLNKTCLFVLVLVI